MSEDQHSPKFIRVKPTVTDPSMKNNRIPISDAERILHEMGEDTPDSDDVRNTILHNKMKTKEEQTHKKDDSDTKGMSTLLIVVFALIVIALVALIVWMVVKQNDVKNEETDIRERLHRHPRNNMAPPGYQHGIPPEIIAQRQMAMQQQQAMAAAQRQPKSPLAQAIAAQQQSMQPVKNEAETIEDENQKNMMSQQMIRQTANVKQHHSQAEPNNTSAKPAEKISFSDELLEKTEAILQENDELDEGDRCMLNSFDPGCNEQETDDITSD